MAEDKDTYSFDVFLSYSTAPDYRLARQLETFIERFHRSRTAKTAQLKHLNACLDGSDFVLSSKERSAAEGRGTDLPTSIPEIIERYLAKSRQLLVLCSPQSMRSPWVRKEIQWFLDNRGPGAIRLVLTRGNEASESPEGFFAPEILEARLHESVWYDLRQFYRDQRSLPKVRDFESERLRIMADLHHRSASSIQPLWIREQQRKARIRYTAITVGLSLTAILGSFAYVMWKTAEAEQSRAEAEQVQRVQEQSLKQVAKTYRHLFSDPFSAAAEAYRANQSLPSEDATAAMSEVHRVLIERQRIAREERSMAKPEGFSFVTQFSPGKRFTRLSRDGSRILVVTERSNDDLFSPKLRGEVFVLDNQTLKLVQLEDCDNQTESYRLEFADFIGTDKILVARAFHVDLYSVDGSCLARHSFQLRASKTPISAAGGLLHEVFFIAGNGAGCVWVNEYGGRQMVEPSRELGAVSYCDDKKNPNALLKVQIDPTETFALNLFQSGRLDLFAMDGRNGGPKRRPVLDQGVRAAVFYPSHEETSFVVASNATETQPSSIERWDVEKRQPVRVGQLPIDSDTASIGFLGFSADGDYLIAMDDVCAMRIWDFETREPLLIRPAGDLPCPHVAESVDSRATEEVIPVAEEALPLKSVAKKPEPTRDINKKTIWTAGEFEQIQPSKTLDVIGLNASLSVLRTKKTLKSMQSGDVLLVIATDPGTVKDFTVFCPQTGTICLQKTEEDGKFFFLLEKQ